jgi:hypothetical protein
MRRLPAVRQVVLHAATAASLCLISGPTPARAQAHSQVRSSGDVQISRDRPDLPHVEPHLAISPDDPMQLVVASIVIDRQGRWRCSVIISHDGGTHWDRSEPNALQELDDCADPWVAFGSGKELYLSVLNGDAVPGGRRRNRAHVFRSPDGGTTWISEAVVPLSEGDGGLDNPTLAVDRSDTDASGTVYVLASQFVRGEPGTAERLHPIVVSASSDSARTFGALRSIQPGNLGHQSGTPVVLADGNLVLSFYDYAAPDPSRLLRSRRLWVVRSVDGGGTFGLPRFVAEFSDFWLFANLAVAPDEGGVYRDRLYSSWTNFGGQWTGSTADVIGSVNDLQVGVWVSYSADQGRTWSRPRAIADSARWANDARHPAVSAGPEGSVAVAWMERSPEQPRCFRPWISISLNGGDEFSPPAPVGNTPSCPTSIDAANTKGRFNAAARWPDGGDYFGLVATGKGTFYLVWSDPRTGPFQVWGTSISIGPNGSPR